MNVLLNVMKKALGSGNVNVCTVTALMVHHVSESGKSRSIVMVAVQKVSMGTFKVANVQYIQSTLK